MNITTFISRFVYRIRYQIIFGVLLAVGLTFYLTQYLTKEYKVSSTLFTGITTRTTLDDMSSNRTDWNAANNAHDNIINLVKSKATLERVSIALLAQHLIYGDELNDNKYITAHNYRALLDIVPPEVLALVDKKSEKQTLQRLMDYRAEDKKNFIYGLLNWTHKHYSYIALSKINISRKGASDMIEISYQSNDPGIAANTLILLNKELVLRYEDLLLSASNDVVKHFEEQLAIAAAKLKQAEDEMVAFNIENKIINYEEQTKHLAALNNNFESRYEQILLDYSSSREVLKELEKQMDTRVKLVHENEVFLEALSDISTLNGKIVELEVFGSNKNETDSLTWYKKQLHEGEQQLEAITNNLDALRYSKEGVSISDMVSQWLHELVKHEKSRSELEVMKARKEDILEQYKTFTPVGPNLKRYDRSLRVAEEKYLSILHHLGLAKLKQKNILLESGKLQIVTPPEFPLLSIPTKRMLFLIAAFLGSIIFIVTLNLLVELVDKTIRDGFRAERFTNCTVIGAFSAARIFKYRRYDEVVKRTAIGYLANTLKKYIRKDQPLYINLLSIQAGEGKSFIAKMIHEYFSEREYDVAYISHHKEINEENKHFFHITNIDELMGNTSKQYDIVLIEYLSLEESNLPDNLLNSNAVNLLILDAQRIWLAKDKAILNNIRERISNNRLFVYLNRTSREVVEEYTGLLPPITPNRKLIYRFLNFGITAKRL